MVLRLLKFFEFRVEVYLDGGAAWAGRRTAGLQAVSVCYGKDGILLADGVISNSIGIYARSWIGGDVCATP